MFELIKIERVYKGKDGKEHKTYNLAIMLDNGRYISVKPSFDEDYRLLITLAKDYK